MGAAPEEFVAVAERVLSEAFGGAVRLGEADGLRGSDRSHVIRCPVAEGPAGAPASVIVKRAGGDEEHPYDPDDARPMTPAWRFFNDWTGAQFLTEVTGDPPLTPRFYGGDRAAGLIVLEDMGSGESLADLLQGNDAERAEAGLLSWAATLGRMHAATIGRVDRYARLCVSLGADEDVSQPGGDVHEGCQKLREQAVTLGLPLPAGFESEVEAVAAALREPGPFLAYTHGDPCPDNDRYIDGQIRLFDWEFGRFRHALIDGVYGRVPFPTCWCVNRLPPMLPPRMESVYRAELVKGCPEAADDAVFYRAVALACAYWLLRTTGWHLSDTLGGEDPTWGISTVRQRVLVRLDTFAETAEHLGHLPALGQMARALAARLRTLWPPEADQMPLYAAFRPRESGA